MPPGIRIEQVMPISPVVKQWPDGPFTGSLPYNPNSQVSDPTIVLFGRNHLRRIDVGFLKDPQQAKKDETQGNKKKEAGTTEGTQSEQITEALILTAALRRDTKTLKQIMERLEKEQQQNQ